MEKKYKRILAVLSVVLVLDLILLCVAIFDVERVELKNYPLTIDYGTLTKEEIIVFNDILGAVENDVSSVQYNGEINKYKILTHLGLYYGSMENVCSLFDWTETEIYLNLDAFQQHEDTKIVIDARVDEAVANIIEGSERFKLWQICNYISERITYTDGVRETVDGLNGKGVCCSYAMLFYKMATRLGVQTYICYGFAGEYHAWNMVILNGECFYYDITWYDKILPDVRYLHSPDSWDREVTLNDLWKGSQNTEKGDQYEP